MESNKLPSEEKRFLNFYGEGADKDTLPNDTQYNFLLKRNKDYMNYIAFSFDKMKIKYEELHTRIDEYARALYARGVREGDIIMVSDANIPEAIYLRYALNKLGAITCPVSPLENEYKVLNDIKLVHPKMFIGINDTYRTFKGASKKISELDIDYLLFPAVESFDNQLIKVLYNAKHFLGGTMAYSSRHSLMDIVKNNYDCLTAEFPEYKEGMVSDIMFTGGSSGTHKGCELYTNGLNAVVQALDHSLILKPGETFLGNLPQFMAFGKMSLHYALCKNLNLLLTMRPMPEDFANELYKNRPNGAMGGAIQWEAFARYIIGKTNNARIQNFDKIKNIFNADYKEYLKILRDEVAALPRNELGMEFMKMPITGGEQLRQFSEEVCNAIFDSLGGQDHLWNGLGMTEMWAPVSVSLGKRGTMGTIGPMLAYNRFKIVDPNTFEELPYNKPGLLLVTGPGMMKGYFNMPEETANVISCDENGTRWLNTGDIAMVIETGEVKYIDRAKRCFVCGVENIYPQQIENLLSQFPEIRETIVTKIKDEELQYVPKYHISLSDPSVDRAKLEQKINKLILNTLGESSTARFFEFYDEPLPRTANGKLDPKPLQQKDNEEAEAKIKKLSL